MTGVTVRGRSVCIDAPDVGRGDAHTIVLFLCSAVLVAAFAVIESCHQAPVIPPRIQRLRTLVSANALTVFIGAVAVGVRFVLSLYAQQVLGYLAITFGLSSVVLAVGATIVSPVATSLAPPITHGREPARRLERRL